MNLAGFMQLCQHIAQVCVDAGVDMSPEELTIIIGIAITNAVLNR